MTRLQLLTPTRHRLDNNDDGDRPPPIARARAQQVRTLDEVRGTPARDRGLYPTPLPTVTCDTAGSLLLAA
jgi:hypothetical protein